MRDPRITKLAKVLVHYSCEVKKGQFVQIKADPVAKPLVEAIYEECLKLGAFVDVRLTMQSLRPIFFKHAKKAQLEWVNPLDLYTTKKADVLFVLWSETNTKELTRVNKKSQSIASSARKPILKTFMQRSSTGKLCWVGTQFPTNSSAQDAEMSLQDYEDFVFQAGYLNEKDPVKMWQKIEAKQQKVVDFLNGKKHLHFKAKNGTDLEVDVSGMKWVNCAGKNNFPDGEVFTGPNLKAKNGGINGIVRYSFPAVHMGQEVEGVELIFEKGKVVHFKASKNEAFLKAMINQDEGAKTLGEIAIGTNFQITDYSKNTLFDEKVGGTFHAALGSGYPETGNSNESGLHWDMVCDLRPGGEISADGRVFHKNGKFTFPGWPS